MAPTRHVGGLHESFSEGPILADDVAQETKWNQVVGVTKFRIYPDMVYWYAFPGIRRTGIKPFSDIAEVEIGTRKLQRYCRACKIITQT